VAEQVAYHETSDMCETCFEWCVGRSAIEAGRCLRCRGDRFCEPDCICEIERVNRIAQKRLHSTAKLTVNNEPAKVPE
jgi:hypothetical protein